MIDEINSKYENFKNVLDVLPVNTKFNRKRKREYLEEEIENDNKRLEIVKKEIESRISKFSTYKENPNISKLESDLEKCNILNEWNSYNNSYEKMHLDYYLYQLHRYYKEDLASVNTCIKTIIESFKKVDINLTKEDFNFNNYVSIYMDNVLNKANDLELRTLFEDIYWKNPEIIPTMEINFKSIYLKYEKKIDKYYEGRHNEFLKKHTDKELSDKRIKLSNDIARLKGTDTYLNLSKFINGEYALNSFKEAEIIKKRDIYFNEGSYSYDKLTNLYQTLIEFNHLIKYKYLFNDMKDKLNTKDTLKGSKANILKEISKNESALIKLNNKQNKKPIFGKKKKDDKLLFEYKKELTTLMESYDKLDEVSFNDLIFRKLNADSTILEVLKLITSNYLYFVSKTTTNMEGTPISTITDMFTELKNYVNNNNFILLNNVALLDEKQMKQLIVDKYNLDNVKLTIDNLMDSNLENTLKDIKLLIDYENVVTSKINISDLELYLEYKKLTEK